MDLDRLDVCPLAWREAPAMLERGHAALAEALGDDWGGSVVLVENAPPASTRDAARASVRDRFPAARRVVLSPGRNLGFGRAMDLALAECRGEYAALVNSDGRAEPGMVEALVAALDERPDAIWAAPAVWGPGEGNEPPGPPVEVDGLAGMAIVVRREAFLALGGFDPLLFFYNEDHDASARLRAAGWALLRVPSVRFRHGKGGRSRRGAAVREWWYATTDQQRKWVHGPSRRAVLRALAPHRARSLREHAVAGTWPAFAGIAAATVAAPVALALAERRRRSPWSGTALAAWLAEHRPRLARTEWPAPAPAAEAAPALAAARR